MTRWPPLVALALAACQHGPALTTKDRAVAALYRGDFTEARPLLEELHRAQPDDVDLTRDWVEAEVKTGRTESLIAELKSVHPVRAIDHYALGLAYFSRAQDTASAMAELTAATRADPSVAEFHHRLGLALLESERFSDAAPELRRAVELAPGRAGYELPLAQALSRAGDNAGAVAALRRFVHDGPTAAQVETARAIMDRIADPFRHFPRAAQAKLDEGLRYLQELDAPQPAIVAFEEILRDYPDLAVVHSLLGVAYQRLDDAGRAVDEYRRASELDATDGKFHLYLGQLYLTRQRSEQAAQELQKAIELNPLLDEAYLALGDIALERPDPHAAIPFYQALAALRPADVNAHGKLAAALENDRDYAAAERELRGILDRQPDNVEFQLRMGLLMADKKLHSTRSEERATSGAEAEKWLKKVLDAQPDNALASRALQSIHAQ